VFDSAPKQDQTGCNGAFILCCDLRYSQNMSKKSSQFESA